MTIDNQDHNMISLQILVGKNKGSAQNRSRFCTQTLPCHFAMIHLSCHQQYTPGGFLEIAMTIDNQAHNMISLQILVGKNKGAPRTDRGSVPRRCRAIFATIHLSCHQQYTPGGFLEIVHEV